MNKKKITIILSVVALLVIFGSSLALFSDRNSSEFVAELGTVEIELDDMNLTNSDRIAPGNGDVNNPDGSTGNVEHKFSFKFKNNGNKSIRTRYTIVLSAKNNNEFLDAKHMSLTENGLELSGKEYLDKDGNTVNAYSDDIKAIKYTLDGDIFDGYGEDILDGGDAEKEDLSSVVRENDKGDVEKLYSYNFILSRDAENEYQNADVIIDVIAEAMQYRNTRDSNFDNIVVSKTYSTQDFEGDFVPSRDEDADGEGF